MSIWFNTEVYKIYNYYQKQNKVYWKAAQK